MFSSKNNGDIVQVNEDIERNPTPKFRQIVEDIEDRNDLNFSYKSVKNVNILIENNKFENIEPHRKNAQKLAFD